jgi:alkaline phosphatase D
MDPRPTRRSLLLGAGAAVALAACSSKSTPSNAPKTLPPPTPLAGVTEDAFALGVASGDPLPNGILLWTRLASDPLHGGGMPNRPLPVDYQVATDEAFGKVIAQGQVMATPQLAHSVHADVRGLAPSTDYFYRFRAGTVLSPVGRTRTAPAAGSAPSQLRLAIANCQDFQNGYWPAFTAMAAEDLDFVLHVGDYIYEYDPKSKYADRKHTTPQTPGLNQLSTLADYRARYGQYKLEANLQAVHAAFPFIAVWDDHEVENNYAGLIDEIDDKGAMHQTVEQFTAQRAAAYQAYYENMPIRINYQVGSPNVKIYRSFQFGNLATLPVLDTRQYRTDQPGGYPGDFGNAKAGDENTSGNLMNSTEEDWLMGVLSNSKATWNVIGQQTMMGQLHGSIAPGEVLANMDDWDGYVPARSRLLTKISTAKVRNPVVLSGDFHTSFVNDLRVDFDKPDTAVVGSEFVSTSVSSAGLADELGVTPTTLENLVLSGNPHTKYINARQHGYTRITVTPQAFRGDMRVVESIATKTSPVSTDASFAIQNGTFGVQKV